MILIITNGYNYRNLVNCLLDHSNLTLANIIKGDTNFICEAYTNDRNWECICISIGCQHGDLFIRKHCHNIISYSVYQPLDNKFELKKIIREHNLRVKGE